MSDTEGLNKTFEVNGKNFHIVRMPVNRAVRYNLRITELLTKHGVIASETLMQAGGKLFNVLNAVDHDEMLFTLLNDSQAEALDRGIALTGWEAVDLVFTPDNYADIYSVALECLKMSVIPIAEGIKNTGLDLSQSPIAMLTSLVSTFLTKSGTSSSAGE